MNLKAIIETILFVRAEPTDMNTLVSTTGYEEKDIQTALDELGKEYHERGFVLLNKNQAWQLVSNPVNTIYVETLVKREFAQELSRSGLETLAIVAYKGPISRVEIEYLRGVNSSFTLRNLMMRGLIERRENTQDARSYFYQVTFDFLKHFGITCMDQLPRFEEFKKQKIEMLEEKSE